MTLTNLPWQTPTTADTPDRPLPVDCRRLRCHVAEPWLDELPTLIARLSPTDRRALYHDLKVKVDWERWTFLRAWDKWLDWAQLFLPFGRCQGRNFGEYLNARPQPWQPPPHHYGLYHGEEERLRGLRELDRQEYERRWEEINKQKDMQSWRRAKRRLVTKRELDKPERVEAALPIYEGDNYLKLAERGKGK